MSTITTFNDGLKDYYTDARTEELTLRDRPLLALLTKFEKFGGRKLPIPLIYGDPQAVSASFSESQGRAGSAGSGIESFDLTRTNLYNTVTIPTELLEASEGDTAAWLDARTTEINGALEAVSNRLAHALYRSGYGEVGTVGSFTGTTITLGNLSDVHGIEVGQVHQFAQSLSGHVLRNSGASLTVIGVNRNTGVITYNADVATTLSALANNDTIFTKGDRQDSATPSRLMVAGLEAWAPSSAVASTAFFGVDRTVDSRLVGLSYNGTSDAPEDAIIEMTNRMAEQGRKATHATTSYRQFSKIVKSQRVLERFVDKISATIGFEGVTIMGARGPVKVIPDQFCPNNRAFVLDSKVVKLYSLKKAVRVIENDGLMVLRQPSADGVEVRVGFKGNLGCNAPTGIGNVQLTPV